ncbi:MAG: hypothetical protein V8S24_11450 [Gordonibacter pamelaeae]
MRKVDAAVIGFGKGGKALAGALAAAGKMVALVEKPPPARSRRRCRAPGRHRRRLHFLSLRYGGTCRTGEFLPREDAEIARPASATKSLVHSAALSAAQEAARSTRWAACSSLLAGRLRIVRDYVLGDGAHPANRGTVPYSVFLDPPFSRAGMTEQEARAAGLREVAKCRPRPFRRRALQKATRDRPAARQELP